MAISRKAGKADQDASAPAVKAMGEAKNRVAADGAGRKAASADLRIGDLVARVAESTGARRGTVRSVAEATLVEVGQALGRGEAVNLPGLGRVRVTKTTERDGRTIMTAKMRHGPGGKAGGKAVEPLAKEIDAG